MFMDRIGLMGTNDLKGTLRCSCWSPWLSHEMVVLSVCSVDSPEAITGEDCPLMYWVKSSETAATSEGRV